jgi:hypothetical protein
LLIGCQNSQDGAFEAADRKFATSEEALGHEAFLLDRSLDLVKPLDRPIARSVTLIIPSQEDIRAFLLSSNAKISDEQLAFLSRYQYNIYAMIERQIARSNRFERIESVIQDNDGGDLTLPANGYGLWINIADAKEPPGRYLRAGSGEWQWMSYRPQHIDEASDIAAFYSAVDKFVADNPLP